MTMMLLVKLRLILYPFFHRFVCSHGSGLEIYVPTQEYMTETGDTEVYMQCPECNKKYIDSKILSRGREYYKRDYITSLEYDDSYNEWTAEIAGSDDYMLNIKKIFVIFIGKIPTQDLG